MNTPAPTEMQPGQSRMLQLPAGACLHLSSGRLVLHPTPGWLEIAVETPAHTLRAGEVYVAPRRVWVRLDALAASRLIWRWPVPRAAAAAPLAWRALLARLKPRAAA
ncbi:MAG TPA: hypothetical protein VLA16_19530 [Ideonella sp.]|nr:hypothetical protein [Ideonella sp.]